LYHQNNIIKHQVLSLYGKSLNLLIKRKLILDHFFFNTLTFLELRLSTLALRMFFFFNTLKVINEIALGFITVNNERKHKNFLVRVNSVIRYVNPVNFNKNKSLTAFNLIKIQG
jgi:hypothetical protein